MNKINSFLRTNINKILIIFLLVQPILDVISGINNNFNINFKINIIIRILFLFCSLFYLLFINKSKYRKISIIYLGFLFLYFSLFTISTIYYKGFDALSFEIKNLILTFYFPILLITFFNLFEHYEVKFNIKYIYYTFLIYLIFICIPNITGLSFESYTQGKVGSSGWFNSANAISSILSLLLPFVIIYLNDKKFNLFYLILIIVFFYCILSLGTKVPLLSLFIMIFFNIIYLFGKLIQKKDFKKIGIISSILIVFITGLLLIIPKTSFYKNIKIHLNFLGVENPIQIVTDIDIIDRFIFSDRLTFLTKTKNVYDVSPTFQKFVGIGYIENYGTDEVSTKLIEMDYYDIFYRHGIIGCIIFFIPLLIITFNIIKKFDKFDFMNINLFTTIFLIYLLAFFSGHVLTVPNVSVFVAFIFTITYFKNNIDSN